MKKSELIELMLEQDEKDKAKEVKEEIKNEKAGVADILNITPQFKEFCKSNHIKIMAAIQNASEKEYKKAIEVHPDLVNLDRPELFIKILHQEIKK